MTQDSVLLTGFADEASGKTRNDERWFDQQLAAALACGLQEIDLRFLHVGSRTRNSIQLDEFERGIAKQRLDDYGLRVSCIGSPIGKVELPSEAEFEGYLSGAVQRTFETAAFFGAKIVRVFSFYPREKANRVVGEQLARKYLCRIADSAKSFGLHLGLELEANLFGNTGKAITGFCREYDDLSVLSGTFDAANSIVQSASTETMLTDFEDMADVQGPLFHVKGFKLPPGFKATTKVDEELLKHFAPVAADDCDHKTLFSRLKALLPGILERNAGSELGLRICAEPHLKGGGQFGGWSGPEGFGLAVRQIRDLLQEVGLKDDELTWEQLQERKSLAVAA